MVIKIKGKDYWVHGKCNTAKQMVMNNMVEFLEDTDQLGFATRIDCVAYVMGYYGSVLQIHWEVINELATLKLIRM